MLTKPLDAVILQMKIMNFNVRREEGREEGIGKDNFFKGFCWEKVCLISLSLTNPHENIKQDPGHALMRCITPPDVEQVRSLSSLPPSLPSSLSAEPVTTLALVCLYSYHPTLY